MVSLHAMRFELCFRHRRFPSQDWSVIITVSLGLMHHITW